MANQQHLYFGSFVLAVPIFCMLIEFVGIRSRESDPVMSKKYDALAHDLMKVSLTAYSWTAILRWYFAVYLYYSFSWFL